nr:MAG TPA: hypothetical protein [Caudoviricetes sp.]
MKKTSNPVEVGYSSFIKEKRRTCFQVLHSSVCVLLLCSVSDPDSL